MKKKVTTNCGFTCEVDDVVLNDMEMLEDIVALSSNDSQKQMAATVRFVEKLLGKKQKRELYDFLRETDGRVPADKVSTALAEIMQGLGTEAKN